jgi:hypothetical protein
MSRRPQTDTSRPATAEASRLKEVLAVGHALSRLESLRVFDQNGVDTGPHVTRKERTVNNEDRFEAMGLRTANYVYPTALDRQNERKLLVPMATYNLYRSNYGSHGVLWSEYATVLFISATGKYNDEYLGYINAQKRRASGLITAQELPEIMYDYPGAQIDRQYLQRLEQQPLTDNTDAYQSSKSNVYVFYKIPVSREDQKLPYGPYLFLGRFMAMPRLNEPAQKKDQIRLKYYAPPPIAYRQYMQMNHTSDPPAPSASVVESDVQHVIDELKERRRQAERAAREEAAAASRGVDDFDRDADMTRPQPVRRVQERQTKPYKIPKRTTNIQDPPQSNDATGLEEGEIAE